MTVERRIGEAEHAIKELDGRVDELRGLTYETRYAVFGFNGDNGLRSEVRALRRDLAQARKDEAKRREEDESRRKATRWQRILLTAGLVGAVLSPVVGWALVTASGGG